MFAEWDNFYVMMGSSSAGLIGLLFVVVTLTSGGDAARLIRGQKLFLSPTAIAFALVLGISAVALAPGMPHAASGALIAAMAAAGFVNALNVCLGLRALQPATEPPHWSDYYMYGVAPTAAYGALVLAAITVAAEVPGAAHLLAGLLLAHMMLALRNAWDLVTWIAPRRPGATTPPPA